MTRKWETPVEGAPDLRSVDVKLLVEENQKLLEAACAVADAWMKVDGVLRVLLGRAGAEPYLFDALELVTRGSSLRKVKL